MTNDDEDNIISALQAKKLGVKQVMALIARTAYVDLFEGSGINTVISPQLITVSYILRYIRRGDMLNVYSLRRGAAEAIELIAHGDRKTSKVVGRSLNNIHLPDGANVCAIVRDDKVLIDLTDIIIESGDHVILFVSDKKDIQKVERLFQVSPKFF